MMSLLRFHKIADYSNHKTIKPKTKISGKEAFEIYLKKSIPLLKEVESNIIFYGAGAHFLVSPESEKWDLIVLTQYRSEKTFLDVIQSEQYLQCKGHRMAAIKHSVLAPLPKGAFLNPFSLN